ncbi:MAG: hypothetical protein R2813_04175 [Flavobacteriales bacterium]
MTLKHRYVLMMSILSTVFFMGCGEEKGARIDNFTEGEIVYEVTYPDLDPNGTLVQVLPEEISVFIKGPKTKTSFKTAAGALVMEVICDAETRTMISTIALFGDQFALKMNSDDIVLIGSQLAGYQVLDTGKVDTIAGVDVRELNIKYPDKAENGKMKISTNFDIPSPNWFTVYEDIPQVLIEYDIVHYNILMHFKAAEIIPKPVDDSEFSPDDDCEYLAKDEFDKFVNGNLDILLSE